MNIEKIILAADIPEEINGLVELYNSIGNAVGFSMKPKSAVVNCTKIRVSFDVFQKILDALQKGFITEYGSQVLTDEQLHQRTNMDYAMSGPSVDKSLPENTISVGIDAFEYDGEFERDETFSCKLDNGLYVPYEKFIYISDLHARGYLRVDILSTINSTLDLGEDVIAAAMGLELLDKIVDSYEDDKSQSGEWREYAESTIRDNSESIIKAIAYHLYKKSWIEEHTKDTEPRTLEELIKEHSESSGRKESFDDWFANKYNNNIYACFDEFITSEYNDCKFMEALLAPYPNVFHSYNN